MQTQYNKLFIFFTLRPSIFLFIACLFSFFCQNNTSCEGAHIGVDMSGCDYMSLRFYGFKGFKHLWYGDVEPCEVSVALKDVGCPVLLSKYAHTVEAPMQYNFVSLVDYYKNNTSGRALINNSTFLRLIFPDLVQLEADYGLDDLAKITLVKPYTQNAIVYDCFNILPRPIPNDVLYNSNTRNIIMDFERLYNATNNPLVCFASASFRQYRMFYILWEAEKFLRMPSVSANQMRDNFDSSVDDIVFHREIDWTLF